MDISQDYYAVLEIDPLAEIDDIRKAYRKLVRKHHPDAQEIPGTAMLFRQVQEAYEILSNPAMRAAYDRARAEAGLSPEAVLRWSFQTNRQQFPTIEEEQMVYVMAEIGAAEQISEKERSLLNLCLVLDRSTSMRGHRLDQVKAATYQLIDSLSPEDTLSVVTFSDRAEVVWPNQPASEPIRAKSRVAAIQASGGTEIFRGMLAGLAEIERRHSDRSVNHMLLLTDGQTYGDEEHCLQQAVEAKNRSISISCLGLGDDWNDALLDAIANRSGGTSAYIASATEVLKLFQEQVRGLSETYAANVQLAIRCVEDCRVNSVFKLAPYISELEPEENAMSLGSIESGKLLPLIIEFSVGSRQAGQHRVAQLELKANIPALERSNERLRHELELDFSQDPPEEPVPPVLLSGLSKIAIYRVQNNAWRALEEGNISEATRRLETVATRLLEVGEHHLARAALLEAGQLARTGNLSTSGRKVIKYGTRSLSFSENRIKEQ